MKIFARAAGKPIPLAPLQAKLCKIWGTLPSTTKLMQFHVADWTDDTFDEDCYVDVRVKATPERTRGVVLDSMAQVATAFKEHGLVANVRLETYEGTNYYHLPPK